jgi:hypothetical protein
VQVFYFRRFNFRQCSLFSPLVQGSVGTSKTRFIKAIEKRYHELSYFALGSGATGAGMINQCFEIQPRFLLIDEIEDLRQSDQASLLSLMQDGVLTETKVSKTRRIEFKCSVFATCNQLKRLRQPLLSPFMVIRRAALQGYKSVTPRIYILKASPSFLECKSFS